MEFFNLGNVIVLLVSIGFFISIKRSDRNSRSMSGVQRFFDKKREELESYVQKTTRRVHDLFSELESHDKTGREILKKIEEDVKEIVSRSQALNDVKDLILEFTSEKNQVFESLENLKNDAKILDETIKKSQKIQEKVERIESHADTIITDLAERNDLALRSQKEEFSKLITEESISIRKDFNRQLELGEALKAEISGLVEQKEAALMTSLKAFVAEMHRIEEVYQSHLGKLEEQAKHMESEGLYQIKQHIEGQYTNLQELTNTLFQQESLRFGQALEQQVIEFSSFTEKYRDMEADLAGRFNDLAEQAIKMEKDHYTFEEQMHSLERFMQNEFEHQVKSVSDTLNVNLEHLSSRLQQDTAQKLEEVKLSVFSKVDLVENVSNELSQKISYIENLVNDTYQQVSLRVREKFNQIEMDQDTLVKRITEDQLDLKNSMYDAQEDHKKWLIEMNTLIHKKNSELDDRLNHEVLIWHEKHTSWSIDFDKQINQEQAVLRQKFNESQDSFYVLVQQIHNSIEDKNNLLKDQVEQGFIKLEQELVVYQEQKLKNLELDLKNQAEVLETLLEEKSLKAQELEQNLSIRYDYFTERLLQMESQIQQDYENNRSWAKEQIQKLEAEIQLGFTENLQNMRQMGDSQLDNFSRELESKTMQMNALVNDRQEQVDTKIEHIDQQFVSLEEFYQNLRQNLFKQEEHSTKQLEEFQKNIDETYRDLEVLVSTQVAASEQLAFRRVQEEIQELENRWQDRLSSVDLEMTREHQRLKDFAGSLEASVRNIEMEHQNSVQYREEYLKQEKRNYQDALIQAQEDFEQNVSSNVVRITDQIQSWYEQIEQTQDQINTRVIVFQELISEKITTAEHTLEMKQAETAQQLIDVYDKQKKELDQISVKLESEHQQLKEAMLLHEEKFIQEQDLLTEKINDFFTRVESRHSDSLCVIEQWFMQFDTFSKEMDKRAQALLEEKISVLQEDRDAWLLEYRDWKEHTLSIIDAEKLEISEVEVAFNNKIIELENKATFRVEESLSQLSGLEEQWSLRFESFKEHLNIKEMKFNDELILLRESLSGYDDIFSRELEQKQQYAQERFEQLSQDWSTREVQLLEQINSSRYRLEQDFSDKVAQLKEEVEQSMEVERLSIASRVEELKNTSDVLFQSSQQIEERFAKQDNRLRDLNDAWRVKIHEYSEHSLLVENDLKTQLHDLEILIKSEVEAKGNLLLTELESRESDASRKLNDICSISTNLETEWQEKIQQLNDLFYQKIEEANTVLLSVQEGFSQKEIEREKFYQNQCDKIHDTITQQEEILYAELLAHQEKISKDLELAVIAKDLVEKHWQEQFRLLENQLMVDMNSVDVYRTQLEQQWIKQTDLMNDKIEKLLRNVDERSNLLFTEVEEKNVFIDSELEGKYTSLNSKIADFEQTLENRWMDLYSLVEKEQIGFTNRLEEIVLDNKQEQEVLRDSFEKNNLFWKKKLTDHQDTITQHLSAQESEVFSLLSDLEGLSREKIRQLEESLLEEQALMDERLLGVKEYWGNQFNELKELGGTVKQEVENSLHDQLKQFNDYIHSWLEDANEKVKEQVAGIEGAWHQQVLILQGSLDKHGKDVHAYAKNIEEGWHEQFEVLSRALDTRIQSAELDIDMAIEATGEVWREKLNSVNYKIEEDKQSLLEEMHKFYTKALEQKEEIHLALQKDLDQVTYVFNEQVERIQTEVSGVEKIWQDAFQDAGNRLEEQNRDLLKKSIALEAAQELISNRITTLETNAFEEFSHQRENLRMQVSNRLNELAEEIRVDWESKLSSLKDGFVQQVEEMSFFVNDLKNNQEIAEKQRKSFVVELEKLTQDMYTHFGKVDDLGSQSLQEFRIHLEKMNLETQELVQLFVHEIQEYEDNIKKLQGSISVQFDQAYQQMEQRTDSLSNALLGELEQKRQLIVREESLLDEQIKHLQLELHNQTEELTRQFLEELHQKKNQLDIEQLQLQEQLNQVYGSVVDTQDQITVQLKRLEQEQLERQHSIQEQWKDFTIQLNSRDEEALLSIKIHEQEAEGSLVSFKSYLESLQKEINGDREKYDAWIERKQQHIQQLYTNQDSWLTTQISIMDALMSSQEEALRENFSKISVNLQDLSAFYEKDLELQAHDSIKLLEEALVQVKSDRLTVLELSKGLGEELNNSYQQQKEYLKQKVREYSEDLLEDKEKANLLIKEELKNFILAREDREKDLVSSMNQIKSVLDSEQHNVLNRIEDLYQSIELGKNVVIEQDDNHRNMIEKESEEFKEFVSVNKDFILNLNVEYSQILDQSKENIQNITNDKISELVECFTEQEKRVHHFGEDISQKELVYQKTIDERIVYAESLWRDLSESFEAKEQIYTVRVSKMIEEFSNQTRQLESQFNVQQEKIELDFKNRIDIIDKGWEEFNTKLADKQHEFSEDYHARIEQVVASLSTLECQLIEKQNNFENVFGERLQLAIANLSRVQNEFDTKQTEFDEELASRIAIAGDALSKLEGEFARKRDDLEDALVERVRAAEKSLDAIGENLTHKYTRFEQELKDNLFIALSDAQRVQEEIQEQKSNVQEHLRRQLEDAEFEIKAIASQLMNEQINQYKDLMEEQEAQYRHSVLEAQQQFSSVLEQISTQKQVVDGHLKNFEEQFEEQFQKIIEENEEYKYTIDQQKSDFTSQFHKQKVQLEKMFDSISHELIERKDNLFNSFEERLNASEEAIKTRMNWIESESENQKLALQVYQDNFLHQSSNLERQQEQVLQNIEKVLREQETYLYKTMQTKASAIEDEIISKLDQRIIQLEERSHSVQDYMEHLESENDERIDVYKQLVEKQFQEMSTASDQSLSQLKDQQYALEELRNTLADQLVNMRENALRELLRGQQELQQLIRSTIKQTGEDLSLDVMGSIEDRMNDYEESLKGKMHRLEGFINDIDQLEDLLKMNLNEIGVRIDQQLTTFEVDLQHKHEREVERTTLTLDRLNQNILQLENSLHDMVHDVRQRISADLVGLEQDVREQHSQELDRAQISMRAVEQAIGTLESRLASMRQESLDQAQDRLNRFESMFSEDLTQKEEDLRRRIQEWQDAYEAKLIIIEQEQYQARVELGEDYQARYQAQFNDLTEEIRQQLNTFQDQSELLIKATHDKASYVYEQVDQMQQSIQKRLDDISIGAKEELDARLMNVQQSLLIDLEEQKMRMRSDMENTQISSEKQLNSFQESMNKEMNVFEQHLAKQISSIKDQAYLDIEELNKDLVNERKGLIQMLDEYKHELLGWRSMSDEAASSLAKELEEKYGELKNQVQENIQTLQKEFSDERNAILEQGKKDTQALVKQLDMLSMQADQLTNLMKDQGVLAIDSVRNDITRIQKEAVDTVRQTSQDLQEQVVQARDSVKILMADSVAMRDEILESIHNQSQQLIEKLADIELRQTTFAKTTPLFKEIDELKVLLEESLHDLKIQTKNMDIRQQEVQELHVNLEKVLTASASVDDKIVKMHKARIQFEEMMTHVTHVEQSYERIERKSKNLALFHEQLNDIQQDLHNVRSQEQLLVNQIKLLQQDVQVIQEKDFKLQEQTQKTHELSQTIDQSVQQVLQMHQQLEEVTQQIKLVEDQRAKMDYLLKFFENSEEKVIDMEHRVAKIDLMRDWIVHAEDRLDKLQRNAKSTLRTMNMISDNEEDENLYLNSKKSKSVNKKDAIIRLYEEGWSIDQIAKQLKVPIGQVTLEIDRRERR